MCLPFGILNFLSGLNHILILSVSVMICGGWGPVSGVEYKLKSVAENIDMQYSIIDCHFVIRLQR